MCLGALNDRQGIALGALNDRQETASSVAFWVIHGHLMRAVWERHEDLHTHRHPCMPRCAGAGAFSIRLDNQPGPVVFGAGVVRGCFFGCSSGAVRIGIGLSSGRSFNATLRQLQILIIYRIFCFLFVF